jgi:hypothetical protein
MMRDGSSVPASIITAAILAAQMPRRNPAYSPEQRLCAAILDDAFEIIRGGRAYGHPGRRLLVETERWLRSNDLKWPFAFRNVCDALGLDPAAVRSSARRERHARPLAA